MTLTLKEQLCLSLQADSIKADSLAANKTALGKTAANGRNTLAFLEPQADSLEVVNLLLAAGADVRAHDRFYKSPLYRARSAAVAARLRKAGALLDRAEGGGTPTAAGAMHSALHSAAQRGARAGGGAARGASAALRLCCCAAARAAG